MFDFFLCPDVDDAPSNLDDLWGRHFTNRHVVGQRIVIDAQLLRGFAGRKLNHS